MERAEKVKLLLAVLNGKNINEALNDKEIGPVLIQMGKDEYYSQALDRTFTESEVNEKLTSEVTYILPHNNR